MVEDHAVPLVSVQLWFAAGAGVDNPDEPGIAVVARCGLANRDEGDLRLRAAGARCVSRTMFDATSFEATILPGMLDLALDVQRVRLEPRAWNDRDVVRAVRAANIAPVGPIMSDYAGGIWLGLEIEQPEPADTVAATLRAALYPGQPCGHEANFVSPAVAARVRGADLDEFSARWFVPGNATLYIIGDVTAADALDRVKKRFAAIPWKEPPRRPEFPSADPALVRKRLETGTAGGLDFAWSVMPWGYAENAALDVLTRVFCDPFEGPLKSRLREMGLPTPDIRREAWRDDGMLVISIDAPEAQRQKIEVCVSDALGDLGERGPTPVALNRARRQVECAIADVRSGFAERAARLAAQDIVGGDMMLDRYERSAVAHVSHGAVKRAAAMLAERRRVVLERRGPATSSAPAASIPSADVGAAAELLDPAEALAALCGDTQAAIPAPDAALKPTETFDVNGVSVRRRTAIGGDRMIVAATIPDCDVRLSAVYGLLFAGTRLLSGAKLGDYLWYRAITQEAHTWRDPATGRPGIVILSECSREDVDATIELLGATIRRPPVSDDFVRDAVQRAARAAGRAAAISPEWTSWLAEIATDGGAPAAVVPTADDVRHAVAALRDAPNVVLDVVGEVPRDEIETAVRELWPAAPVTTRPAIADAVAARSATGPTRVIWSPGEEAAVEAMFIVPLAGISGAHDSYASAAAAAWLLGAPDATWAEIDGQRRWRWRCEVSGGALRVSARLNVGEATPRVRAMRARIGQLLDSGIPEAERATARRLAAVSATLSAYDNREAWRWLGWPSDAATPQRWPGDKPRHGPVTLIVVGGGRAMADELDKTMGEVERVVKPAP